jgi:hypothetical protein
MFALPTASSWQSVDENIGPLGSANNTAPAPSGPLVDRDFRRNFVDNQRQLSSTTNLATLGRGRKTGSVVRFEEEPQVICKGKERAQSPAHECTEASHRRQRSDSQVISDSDELEPTGLPRVQSNLSKLIKEERKSSGGEERLPAQPQAAPAPSTAARRKEEEILAMGRKAGAPIIPKGRPGSRIAERMRSPSPGATF